MQDLKLESHCGFALSFFEFSLVVVWTADEDSYFFSGWLSRHGWPFGSFGKGLASQLWGRSLIPRRLFLWARNPALSSWANAATACGDPKIATAHCAITCCITLLYCVRMPAPCHASHTVIHVLWLCAPFRNDQSMQTRRESMQTPYARRISPLHFLCHLRLEYNRSLPCFDKPL